MVKKGACALISLGSSLLAGCGDGVWAVTTWGEEYIEQEIPAEIFEDGCSATYDTFLVNIAGAALLDGDGKSSGALGSAQVFDMTQPGPHPVGEVAAPATHYDTAEFRVAPASGAEVAGNATGDQTAEMISAGASVLVAGTLTCSAGAVTFRWVFQTDTTYRCEPDDLTLPAGGEDTTQLTIHGDHLFYDGLENPDAVVRGEAIVAADSDGDGAVTMEELSAVSVSGLGYQVGQYSDVSDLGAFVTFLTQTLGHVDGEGHCQVDL